MPKVTYIGKRENHIEGCYGSMIAFTKGETKNVPSDLATKLIKHKDQFELFIEEPGDTDMSQPDFMGGNPETSEETIKEKDTSDEEREQQRFAVQHMNKIELSEFVHANFCGFKLNKKKSENNLRIEVIGLIDQFGID